MTEGPPRDLSPTRWQGRHAAVGDLLEAYVGLPADDAPGAPSAALAEYLGVLRLVDPAGPSVTAVQLRRLLDEDGFGLSGPTGLAWPPVLDRRAWLATVAELIESDSGSGPLGGIPATAWGWRRRFPQLFQLFGGGFGEDFPLEYPDLPPVEAEARTLSHWLVGAPDAIRARAVGELHELLALRLDRTALELALGALGRDVELAPDPHVWLRRVVAYLEAA
ncbi:hypothetical protein DN069_07875 [Streptacidiphilus pinicola]|uniref:CdiI immunity protein domain-containing protein n=1 Tax=Streptacidiphilus pinicola TaxID=2219663 RepID=A0A2X0KAF5_9ACTN|nr:hypothetical protein [Streptacidiphilus pinicola]RAG86185.1 hypothetical protein DN069_07875 [Streptacidiphilus pinicola]